VGCDGLHSTKKRIMGTMNGTTDPKAGLLAVLRGDTPLPERLNKVDEVVTKTLGVAGAAPSIGQYRWR